MNRIIEIFKNKEGKIETKGNFKGLDEQDLFDLISTLEYSKYNICRNLEIINDVKKS